jgi:hypothetical protein
MFGVAPKLFGLYGYGSQPVTFDKETEGDVITTTGKVVDCVPQELLTVRTTLYVPAWAKEYCGAVAKLEAPVSPMLVLFVGVYVQLYELIVDPFEDTFAVGVNTKGLPAFAHIAAS